MKLSKIIIHDLKFYGFHGVYPKENVVGTSFAVDLDITINSELACFDDDQIEHAVNYETLVSDILYIGTHQTFKLIEKLAQIMAESVLAHDNVLQVTVTVHKLVTGLTPEPQWIAVSRTLSKSDAETI